MFYMTADQEYLLSVMEQTGWLRRNQAVRLLYLLDKGKDEVYTARLVNQLQHMQKISWKADELILLPHLKHQSVDRDMMSAVDVMLDLTDTRLIAVSAHKPPFKLCFLTEMKDKTGSYAVMLTPLGSEARVSFLLQDVAEQRTAILLLDNLEQRGLIKTPMPHFFALYDRGRYRYFEGNA